MSSERWATMREKYEPAMRIDNQADADAYFARCVAHTMEIAKVSRRKAEQSERRSLGYYAGYYDNTTRARVEQLFRCAHPYFGAIAENGAPAPEKAFAIGLELGRKLRAREE